MRSGERVMTPSSSAEAAAICDQHRVVLSRGNWDWKWEHYTVMAVLPHSASVSLAATDALHLLPLLTAWKTAHWHNCLKLITCWTACVFYGLQIDLLIVVCIEIENWWRDGWFVCQSISVTIFAMIHGARDATKGVLNSYIETMIGCSITPPILHCIVAVRIVVEEGIGCSSMSSGSISNTHTHGAQTHRKSRTGFRISHTTLLLREDA